MCHNSLIVGLLLIINILKDVNSILFLCFQTFDILNFGLHGFNLAILLLDQNTEARQFDLHLVNVKLYFCLEIEPTIPKRNNIGGFRQKWEGPEFIKSELSRSKILITKQLGCFLSKICYKIFFFCHYRRNIAFLLFMAIVINYLQVCTLRDNVLSFELFESGGDGRDMSLVRSSQKSILTIKSAKKRSPAD